MKIMLIHLVLLCNTKFVRISNFVAVKVLMYIKLRFRNFTVDCIRIHRNSIEIFRILHI